MGGAHTGSADDGGEDVVLGGAARPAGGVSAREEDGRSREQHEKDAHDHSSTVASWSQPENAEAPTRGPRARPAAVLERRPQAAAACAGRSAPPQRRTRVPLPPRRPWSARRNCPNERARRRGAIHQERMSFPPRAKTSPTEVRRGLSTLEAARGLGARSPRPRSGGRAKDATCTPPRRPRRRSRRGLALPAPGHGERGQGSTLPPHRGGGR